MKSNPGQCLGISQLVVVAACLLCALSLMPPSDVFAGAKDIYAPSLQEQIAKEKSRGPIFVAIPVAYRYGIGGENETYCSPSIRATNSSNATVEELIVGIQYLTTAGKPAGETVTRYADIKVHRQDTHFFYQLSVPECRGLEGHVSVVRCVYSTGEDCSAAVQAIGFGTIPLRLKSR